MIGNLAQTSTPALPELRTESLQAQAYGVLKNALINGTFTPGQSVSLRSLSREFKVSEMPVREAVGRLIAERALELSPSRAIRVPLMTRGRFQDLVNVRELVEGHATYLAATRMSAASLDHLQALQAQMNASLNAGNIASILFLNREFHFHIYGLSQSEALVPLIESLWLQAGPFMHTSWLQSPDTWNGAHHDVLLAALRAGDPEASRTAMVGDIRSGAESLLLNGAFVAE